MVEKILGEQVAEDIFYSSMLTGLMTEKQAEELVQGIEKEAKIDLSKFFKGIGGAAGVASGAVGEGAKAVMSVPKILGLTALLGVGTGALGTYAVDAIKSTTSKEDPEVKFNASIEGYYKKKKRELEDSKWMNRVIAMRDELRRGHKKMSDKEYSKKYNDLIEALEERS